jgi:hypothetical protein
MPFLRYRRFSRRGPGVHPGLTRADSRGLASTLPALAAVLLLAASVGADAALYKWTDANGRVVYSDQPPPGNAKVETLSGPPPPANPNAVKEMVNKEAELKKQQLDRTEAAQKVDKEAVEARRVREACVKARDQVRQLAATQDVLVRINEKGERVVIDPETRQRERENVEKWIGQNCRP